MREEDDDGWSGVGWMENRSNNTTWIWSFFEDLLLRDIFIIIIAFTQKFIIFLISYQDDVRCKLSSFGLHVCSTNWIIYLDEFLWCFNSPQTELSSSHIILKMFREDCKLFHHDELNFLDELGEFNWKFRNSAISAEFMAEIVQISNFMLEIMEKL